MVNLGAGEIARITGGELLGGDPLLRAAGVCSDSRQVCRGEFFIPLRGPNFDGHDFIKEAMAKGAAGSLVQYGRMESVGGNQGPGKFFVLVRDVLQALGDLALSWRCRHSIPVVAITGSNGKTTTKEMAASILSKRFNVLKTEGNWNNLIGVPLSLLKLEPVHEVAILEMGMNVPGEIRRLRAIAEPHISTINNIGPSHLEFLENLEGVARAKGELWEAVGGTDWIAVNVDDPRVVQLASSARCQKKTFGILHPADIYAEDLCLEPGKGIRFSLIAEGARRPVQLNTFGNHNVSNALAAAALAKILGIHLEEIRAGLEEFWPLAGRGKILFLGRDIKILDDSYNANPNSFQATLSAFREMKGENRGILVMGDMLELGSTSAEEHEKAGKGLAAMGLAYLIFLGEKARHMAEGACAEGVKEENVRIAKTHMEVLTFLGEKIKKGDCILVKGSRAMKMERIIQGLENLLGRAC